MAAKKKATAAKATTTKKTATKKTQAASSTATAKTSAKPAAKKVAAKKVSAKKTAAKKAVAKKSASAKVAAKKPAPQTAVNTKKASAPAKKAAAPAAKKATAAASKKVSAAKPVAPDKTKKDPKPTKKKTVPTASTTASNPDDYMNAEQSEHFRAKLLEWKQQLMAEVDRTVDHMKDDATNFPDPNDRATQEEEFSLELRTRDRERKLIKKIDESLRAIDSGDYGFCESCGIEIGEARLEARPTATMCIDCKTMAEIRERQSA